MSDVFASDYVSFFQTIYEVLMKIAFEFIDIPKKLDLATFHNVA